MTWRCPCTEKCTTEMWSYPNYKLLLELFLLSSPPKSQKPLSASLPFALHSKSKFRLRWIRPSNQLKASMDTPSPRSLSTLSSSAWAEGPLWLTASGKTGTLKIRKANSIYWILQSPPNLKYYLLLKLNQPICIFTLYFSPNFPLYCNDLVQKHIMELLPAVKQMLLLMLARELTSRCGYALLLKHFLPLEWKSPNSGEVFPAHHPPFSDYNRTQKPKTQEFLNTFSKSSKNPSILIANLIALPTH